MPTTIGLENDAAAGFEFPSPAPPTARNQRTLQPDDQPVLSIRASVPKLDAQRFIADALHDIRVFMQEHELPPAGPPFSVCRPRGRGFDIEAGWPTARAVAGTSRIHSGSLPRSLTGPRDKQGRVAAVESRRC